MPSVLRGKYGTLLKSHKYFYVDHVSGKSDDRQMSGTLIKGCLFSIEMDAIFSHGCGRSGSGQGNNFRWQGKVSEFYFE